MAETSSRFYRAVDDERSLAPAELLRVSPSPRFFRCSAICPLDFSIWRTGEILCGWVQKLAYIAPPTDDHFYVEIFGGGDPRDVRPYSVSLTA